MQERENGTNTRRMREEKKEVGEKNATTTGKIIRHSGCTAEKKRDVDDGQGLPELVAFSFKTPRGA